MKNTTTVVIAAAVVLAAVIVTRTPAQPAGGGGRLIVKPDGSTWWDHDVAGAENGTSDPCPSDIDNDAMVGINDFLILLGDWGPCPTPKVIGVASWDFSSAVPELNTAWAARLWSSGLVELLRITGGGCWSCAEAWPPALTWVDFGIPATPSPEAKPIDIEFGYSNHLLVVFSDGTVFQSQVSSGHKSLCDGEPGDHCVHTQPIWEPLP